MYNSKTSFSSASLQQPDFENKVNQLQKIFKEKSFTFCFTWTQHTNSKENYDESHSAYASKRKWKHYLSTVLSSNLSSWKSLYNPHNSTVSLKLFLLKKKSHFSDVILGIFDHHKWNHYISMSQRCAAFLSTHLS